MKWRALATDYDGTIATDGHVDERTLGALRQLKDAGLAVLLVTGRELRDFPGVGLDLAGFDAVVAENGGLLFFPGNQETRLTATAPPPEFIAALHRRGVGPISVGACIVATWEPHEIAVMETIKEMGLELSVIFNKGAVMILPTGVNKASGLLAALEALQIAPESVVAVGDAENDHALLQACGLRIAVANALPALKAQADHVTTSTHGAGVVELIDALLRGALDNFRRE